MTSKGSLAAADAEGLKRCCAQLYESEVVKLLLGDSFHPGGLRLTERLGLLLRLTAGSRVLDAASGTGASALFLAERFGCEVVGIDYGRKNVEAANEAAAAMGLSRRVRFEHADAERLPFDEACFDAVVCECAFCTFPAKAEAAAEFARVLRDGGQVGLSDLTLEAELPEELEGIATWISCIADALPLDRYVACLAAAGFSRGTAERHDAALLEMVRQIQGKLFGAELLVGLKKIELPEMDFSEVKRMAKAVLAAIEQGRLGYAIVTGSNRET